MSLALLLAALPVLYWDQPASSSADALRRAGDREAARAARTRRGVEAAGLDATPLAADERAARVALKAPGIAARGDLASATRRPWIDANGWRYQRQPQAALLRGGARRQGRAGRGRGFRPRRRPGARDRSRPTSRPLGEALALFRALPEGPDLPALADLAVVDDGSFAAGELMNLLARRNLLFRPVPRAPPPTSPLRVELGSKQYPKAEAGNPDALALKIRAQLGDERRSLRVYGSEVVLARLTGDAARLRLHLSTTAAARSRACACACAARGRRARPSCSSTARSPSRPRCVQDGATEFSLPVLGPYAVVDLVRSLNPSAAIGRRTPPPSPTGRPS